MEIKSFYLTNIIWFSRKNHPHLCDPIIDEVGFTIHNRKKDRKKKIAERCFGYFFIVFSIFTVAWFTFDPQLSGEPGSGLVFGSDNSTVSVEGWEHCVALGSVGFSRGIHYWEFTIDKYTADTDPAFGVARIDVARNKMLGKYQTYIQLYGIYE